VIRIRIGTATDHDRLVDFIRTHWSATHIFTHCPDVFAWQHLQADGRLNMVIAEQVGDESADVLGVLGFIPMGRFSRVLGDRDVFLAIWKVDEMAAPPGLGLRLLKFIQSELKPRMIAAIGTSEMVRPIYKVLRYEEGVLHQSAIFHPSRHGKLRVAQNVPASAFVRPNGDDTGLEFHPITIDADAATREAVDHLAANRTPTKDWTYVVERYLSHPWFVYHIRLVVTDGSPAGVVIWRTVTAEDTTVLRIVDAIGDPSWFERAGLALRAEVVAADAEYIDLMQWGIESARLARAGFVSLEDHPEMIIPNYFSPFERRNVTIWLALRVFDDTANPAVLFRADSDQDRPNQVFEEDREI
jgi:hypothetical protein